MWGLGGSRAVSQCSLGEWVWLASAVKPRGLGVSSNGGTGVVSPTIDCCFAGAT